MCTICDPRSQYTDCICNPNFKSFDQVYKNKFSEDEKYTSFNVIKKWDISTMTVCCCFNSVIDTEKYKAVYNDENGKKQFYNCANIYITVKYQNKPKVSAKIFSNGNIQLAGVLNPYSTTYALRKLFKRLSVLNAFTSETAHISNARICMINSDFKIDKYIKQSDLCKILDQGKLNYLKTYSFNPNKYPGVNIKMQDPDSNKVMSCIVFRPGSVIITGGNDIASYERMYRCIIDAFVRNESLLTCPI
jgi:TATA-box binding protein (TBP) (component of TFIID and TFIIIB)